MCYGFVPGQAQCLQYRLCQRMTTSSGCLPWVGRNLWVSRQHCHLPPLTLCSCSASVKTPFSFLSKQIGHYLGRTYSKERGGTSISHARLPVCTICLVKVSQSFINAILSHAVDAQLDDVGLSFVKNSINAIEKRGKFQMWECGENTESKSDTGG